MDTIEKNNLVLYRADYKGNETKPEEFWKSGLWSKLVNSGNSMAIEKYGWLKTIKSHIKPIDQEERFLYNTTSYLSFTSSYSIAEKYLIGKDNRNYTPTSSIKDANGYIFKFSINTKTLTLITPGVYLYCFNCNPDRYLYLTLEYENPTLCFRNFNHCTCTHFPPNFIHKILLIDCVEYLGKNKDSELDTSTSLNSAHKDKEWLILSLDPYTSIGRSAIIPVANFWDYTLFKENHHSDTEI